MVVAILAGILCSILAVFCAYWAIDRAQNGTGDGDEYITKQLTAGAWASGCVSVAFFATAAWIEYTTPPKPEVPREQTTEG